MGRLRFDTIVTAQSCIYRMTNRIKLTLASFACYATGLVEGMFLVNASSLFLLVGSQNCVFLLELCVSFRIVVEIFLVLVNQTLFLFSELQCKWNIFMFGI